MATTTEIIAGTAVEVVIFGVAGMLLYRVSGKVFNLPKRMKVTPFHKGLFLRGTTVDRIVDPGTYWVRQSQTLVQADMRPKPFQVPAKVLIAEDGGALQISFSGEYRIVDPARFVTSSSDAYGALFLELGKAIAASVAEFDRASILSGTAPLTDRIRERSEPRAAELGLQVAQLTVTDSIPLYPVAGAQHQSS